MSSSQARIGTPTVSFAAASTTAFSSALLPVRGTRFHASVSGRGPTRPQPSARSAAISCDSCARAHTTSSQPAPATNMLAFSLPSTAPARSLEVTRRSDASTRCTRPSSIRRSSHEVLDAKPSAATQRTSAATLVIAALRKAHRDTRASLRETLDIQVGFSPPRSPNKLKSPNNERTTRSLPVRSLFCSLIRRGECDECVR